MADKIQCDTHGERQSTFVCSHFLGETAGLGFNRDEPDADKPFPDAWCDDCEIIRSAHGGWTEESEKLCGISLLCSGCYEKACIRNTRTSVTLNDLSDLRWKCGSCEEWHTGPCLDFGYSAPSYWRKPYEQKERPQTFLDENYCAIDDKEFFVRGIIHLPIIGSAESLRWGAWGSLSRENFKTLLQMDRDPKRVELPDMFSWLSTRISEYPDTLNLKMHAVIQQPGRRPHFVLEPTAHPLSQEYHNGISADRVKEIMTGRLKQYE